MDGGMLYMSHSLKSTFKEAKVKPKSALLAALLLLKRVHMGNGD